MVEGGVARDALASWCRVRAVTFVCLSLFYYRCRYKVRAACDGGSARCIFQRHVRWRGGSWESCTAYSAHRKHARSDARVEDGSRPSADAGQTEIITMTSPRDIPAVSHLRSGGCPAPRPPL
ncbi:uncharacterized protein J3D65DRAFT_578979, partial [Phyllosticta citribraziliensis]